MKNCLIFISWFRILNGGPSDSRMSMADEEKKNLSQWHKRPIELDQRFIAWVNKDVFKSWGFKAAARAYNIAKTGNDIEITGAYKDQKPTTIGVRKTSKVPGMDDRAEDAFGVSQILAWLAKERTDVQEQYEWRRAIPKLMTKLLRGRS